MHLPAAVRVKEVMPRLCTAVVHFVDNVNYHPSSKCAMEINFKEENTCKRQNTSQAIAQNVTKPKVNIEKLLG